MQQLPNTTFLFTGSRKSAISDMLTNESRPFYRSCQTLDFPSLGEEFIDWIIGRFHRVGVECDRQALPEFKRAVQKYANRSPDGVLSSSRHGRGDKVDKEEHFQSAPSDGFPECLCL